MVNQDKPAIGEDTDTVALAGLAGEQPGRHEVLQQLQSTGPIVDLSRAGIQKLDLSKLRVLALLSTGGFARVYKAQYYGTLVALKVLLPVHRRNAQTKHRLSREMLAQAYIAEQAGTAPVVRAEAVYEHHCFIGAPLCNGSLQDLYLGRLQSLFVEDSSTVVPQQVTEASNNHSYEDLFKAGSKIIAAAKATTDEGFVHMDLKPGNLLLHQQHQRILLNDYGLTVPIGEDNRSNLVVGSVHYMPPEQIASELLDAALPSLDVYALGSVLFQLLHKYYKTLAHLGATDQRVVSYVAATMKRKDYDDNIQTTTKPLGRVRGRRTRNLLHGCLADPPGSRWEVGHIQDEWEDVRKLF